MKRNIILLITALFCFMPQAKAHAPAPAVALAIVYSLSGAAFLLTALLVSDDYLESGYCPDESTKKFLLGSAAVSIASFGALAICYPNGFEHPEAVA